MAPLECKPRHWKRYVDDVLAVITKEQTQYLQDHMNKVDVSGNIKWMREEETDKSLPFLDAQFTREEGGTIHIMVFRKQIHII